MRNFKQAAAECWLLLGWGEEEGRWALTQLILQCPFSPHSSLVLPQTMCVCMWQLCPFLLPIALDRDNRMLSQGTAAAWPLCGPMEFKIQIWNWNKTQISVMPLSLTHADLILCFFKHWASLLNECLLKGETLKPNSFCDKCPTWSESFV